MERLFTKRNNTNNKTNTKMKYEIDFQDKVITIDGVQYEIAPKKCSFTNILLSEGFLYGDQYVADSDEAKNIVLKESDYDTWEELTEDLYEDGGDEFYYTEWELYDEFYTENGLYFYKDCNDEWQWQQTIDRKEVIEIKWSTTDVVHRANERGFMLTFEQAYDILSILGKDHDATIGINWEVIDTITDNYLNE